MENTIVVKFNKDTDIDFEKISKIKFNKINGLILTLPIHVFLKKDFFEYDLLFSTEVSTCTNEKELISIFESYNSKKFNIEIFLNTYFGDSTFQDLISKGKNWSSEEILEPISLLQYPKSEFIEVDNFTDFQGNFTQNNKLGASLNFGENEYKNIKSFNPKPFVFSLPREIDVYKFNKLSSKEKINTLIPYGIEVTITTIEKAYKQDHSLALREKYYPYYVSLSGNDDCSYTKYFCTENSMMQEVYRLRRCQPINTDIDVINNGYFYTN